MTDQELQELLESANESPDKICIIDSVLDNHQIKILCDFIRTSAIEKLILSRCLIKDEGAKALADALKTNTSLIALNLSNNNVEDKGAASLADALKTNTSLIELNLSNNNVEDEGAEALADALKRNTSLTELDLSDIIVGDAGVASLADALKVNTSLVSLDLRYNEINAEGAEALADALKRNTSLTELNLSYNNVGDAGAASLADALKVNTSLVLLDLRDNEIGDEGAEALTESLQRNYHIFIDTDGTENDTEKFKTLNELIERNVEMFESVMTELIIWERKDHTTEEYAQMYDKLSPRLGLVKMAYIKNNTCAYFDAFYAKCKEAKEAKETKETQPKKIFKGLVIVGVLLTATAVTFGVVRFCLKQINNILLKNLMLAGTIISATASAACVIGAVKVNHDLHSNDIGNEPGKSRSL